MNGAGEFGESVYGEKADVSPPVGEGIRGLFNAMTAGFLTGGRSCGRTMGCVNAIQQKLLVPHSNGEDPQADNRLASTEVETAMQSS